MKRAILLTAALLAIPCLASSQTHIDEDHIVFTYIPNASDTLQNLIKNRGEDMTVRVPVNPGTLTYESIRQAVINLYGEENEPAIIRYRSGFHVVSWGEATTIFISEEGKQHHESN